MALSATVQKKAKEKPTKQHVIQPDAPKSIRRQARKITVVALDRGYYDHKRIKPGTTFEMYVSGDADLPLPEWVALPDAPEAVALLEEIIEAARKAANLPAGVSASKATLPYAARIREPKEDDDDDDDDDDSAGGSGGGGGSGGSVI